MENLERFAKLFIPYSTGNGELLKDAEQENSMIKASFWKEELLTGLCDAFKESKSFRGFGSGAQDCN